MFTMVVNGSRPCRWPPDATAPPRTPLAPPLTGKGFDLAGRKKVENFGNFSRFLVRIPPNIHGLALNLARRRGPAVPSAVPNLTLIRESCRPCGAKKLKIAC